MPRCTATIPSLAGSEKLLASNGDGPSRWALYVSYPTSLVARSLAHPIIIQMIEISKYPQTYSHDIPYAAVTNIGGTTGRKASPSSLVCR